MNLNYTLGSERRFWEGVRDSLIENNGDGLPGQVPQETDSESETYLRLCL